jgi:hypothetical protein
MDSGKDINSETDVLQAVHFTAAAWQQVMPMTIVNFICLCAYRIGFNTEADACSCTDDDDNDNAFREDWTWLDPEDGNFSSYISVDNDLETWAFTALISCVMISWVGTAVRKMESYTNMTFNHCCFTETHTPYATVKSFFHSFMSTA